MCSEFKRFRGNQQETTKLVYKPIESSTRIRNKGYSDISTNLRYSKTKTLERQ